MKSPLTPAGIEPATFLFVAQHLNHCATAVPMYIYIIWLIYARIDERSENKRNTQNVIKVTFGISFRSEYARRVFKCSCLL